MTSADPYYRFLLHCLAGTASSLPKDPSWRWERFIELASSESLLPAIYSLLLHAGLLPEVPGEVADFFFAARELNRERNREILERVAIIASSLNRAQLEPLLLKGLAYLLTGVFGDRADRFLVDIDLLVDRQDIPKALEVLQQLGYCFERSDPIDHATSHTYAVLSRSDSMTVDLHQTTGLGASSEILPAREALSHSVVFYVEGVRVRIPAAEDLVVHHILHSQVHELYRDRIWTPVRSLYELALLQQRFGPALDWQRIAQLFKSKRLYGTLALYLMQAERAVGFRSPLKLSLGPLLRLRWWHRELLRKTPAARFFDPFWFYSAGLVPRTRRLREILNQPGGVRYVLRKLFSVEFFLRLKTDVS